MDVSVVIPCYCSGSNIQKVVQELHTILTDNHYTYEIILVNDGSPDNTFEIISEIAKSYDNIYAIDLAKNSGQHNAIMAGFNYAHGDYVVTCEDDGQSQVKVLPKLFEKLKEGYDVAAPVIYRGQRGKRSLFRRATSRFATYSLKTMIPRPEGIIVPVFFAAKQFIIREIIRYNLPYPFLEGLVLRNTYHVALIDSEQRDRIDGQSGYTLKKLFNLWMNSFTTFSVKPLRLSFFAGLGSAVIGLLLLLLVIALKIAIGYPLTGGACVIAVLMFMLGMVLVSLGVIGEYVGRIYMCINKAPQFVVRQVTVSDNISTKNERDHLS